MSEIDSEFSYNSIYSKNKENNEIINDFKYLILKKIETKTNLIYNEIEKATSKIHYILLKKHLIS